MTFRFWWLNMQHGCISHLALICSTLLVSRLASSRWDPCMVSQWRRWPGGRQTEGCSGVHRVEQLGVLWRLQPWRGRDDCLLITDDADGWRSTALPVRATVQPCREDDQGGAKDELGNVRNLCGLTPLNPSDGGGFQKDGLP